MMNLKSMVMIMVLMFAMHDLDFFDIPTIQCFPKQSKEMKISKMPLFKSQPISSEEEEKVIISIFLDYGCGYCSEEMHSGLRPVFEKLLDHVVVDFFPVSLMNPHDKYATKVLACVNRGPQVPEFKRQVYEFYDCFMNDTSYENLPEKAEKCADQTNTCFPCLEDCVKSEAVNIKLKENEILFDLLNIDGVPQNYINTDVYGGYQGEFLKILCNKYLSKLNLDVCKEK